MITREKILSDLECQVLQKIKTWMKKNFIILDLSITQSWINKIFKKFKKLWFTKIKWYGWSWCNCILSENQNHCDCEWSPYVWRFTSISEKWEDYLNNLIPNK